MSIMNLPLRVLHESRVSPPLGSVAQSTLPLTFFDVHWLFARPVERLFFYRFPHPTAYFVDEVLPNLKSSLSLTLQQFYPLSGNVKRSPDSDDKFEICYNEGDAVWFTLAEYDQDFEELSGCHKCDFSKIIPLVPELPSSAGDAKPLFATQVTVFPGRGICIGVAIHHVVCDGLSSINFIKSWASACTSGGLAPFVGPPPLHDRTLIADPHGLYSHFYKEIQIKISKPAGSSGNASRVDAIFAVFTLGSDQIQRLKKVVAGAAGSNPFHCSTFVLSLAFAWICLVKTHGYVGERTAHTLFIVDCRALLNPPVPASYFGNCGRPCFVGVKKEELITDDGIVAASKAIGKAIERSKEEVLHGAEGWHPRIRSMLADQTLTLAGSPKFRVYDTDFGWGRPQRVEIPSIQGTRAISMAESREDQGGVEIGLDLKKHDMDEFEVHFYSGLQQIEA